LLRQVSLPPELESVDANTRERSGTCLVCHAPTRPDKHRATVPEASQAFIWAGRGGLDPDTGAAVNETGAHAKIAGGCVACHRVGPSGLERGAGHAFEAHLEQCRLCHAELPAPRSFVSEATRLWQALAARGPAPRAQRPSTSSAEPLHARAHDIALNAELGRAQYNVALVLADRAAHVHNPRYVKKLLHLARRALESHEQPKGAGR
jgi:hypothetical protein